MNNKVTEEESNKTCGFKRGLEAERILGSADDNGELVYLMQWWVVARYPCYSSINN